MIWPTRKPRIQQISNALQMFSANNHALPGVAGGAPLEALTLQIVASLRRQDYTRHLMSRPIDPRRADPNSELFDPERAAIWHARNGNPDEAVWLIFLATHFGKHARYGWRRLRDVYSGLGTVAWTWQRTSNDVTSFRTWLEANQQNIRGAFGNHRKYESLSGQSQNGTGAAVASYVDWIGPTHNHGQKFAQLVLNSGNNPETIFDHFYLNMDVHRFGRLGKFDFLALIGRLKFAPIEPGKAYLKGATGPIRGARLLFGGSVTAALSTAQLEQLIGELDAVLKVGKQVMEDSLCNWQKSPSQFVHFRG